MTEETPSAQGQDEQDIVELPTFLLVEKYCSFPVCILSVFGAALIILAVFQSEKNRKNIQQRLVGFMSISDFLLPFLRLTGFLWLPKDQGPEYIGNETTCDIQGFLNITFFTMTLTFNASLAMYYLLVIKFNWKPRRLKKIENLLYLVPVGNGLFWATVAVVLDVVNPPEDYYGTNLCVVQKDRDYPFGFDDPKYQVLSTRAEVLHICFAVGYLGMIVFNVFCIFVIYIHVKKTESKSASWLHLNEDRLVRTKLVATRFKLFALVFIVPGTLYVISNLLSYSGVAVPGWYQASTTSLVFTAGFLNSIVYFRPRYMKVRKESPNSLRVGIIWNIIREILFPCSSCKTKVHKRKITTILADKSIDCEPELEDYVEPSTQKKKPVMPLRARQRSKAITGTDWKSLKANGVRTLSKSFKSLKASDGSLNQSDGSLKASGGAPQASEVHTLNKDMITSSKNMKISEEHHSIIEEVV